jgi:hypothetical protein
MSGEKPDWPECAGDWLKSIFLSAAAGVRLYEPRAAVGEKAVPLSAAASFVTGLSSAIKGVESQRVNMARNKEIISFFISPFPAIG